MKGKNLKSKHSHLYLILVGFCLLIAACKGDKAELMNVDTVILISDKIGASASKKIPKVFVELALPLQECDKANFRLVPNLIRMDEKESKLSLAFDLKSRSGNTDNPRLAKRLIEEELQTYTIGDAFAVENSTTTNTEDKLKYFLANKVKKAKIFYFSENGESAEKYNDQEVIFSLEKLQSAINQSLCEEPISQIAIIYNPPNTADNEMPDFPSERPLEVEKIFSEIGNVDVSPDIRLDKIEDYIDYFTEDADVKELGEAGTILALTPVRTYLEKIAFYKTTDRIEIKKALKKEDGKYWEIRVVEYH